MPETTVSPVEKEIIGSILLRIKSIDISSYLEEDSKLSLLSFANLRKFTTVSSVLEEITVGFFCITKNGYFRRRMTKKGIPIVYGELDISAELMDKLDKLCRGVLSTVSLSFKYNKGKKIATIKIKQKEEEGFSFSLQITPEIFSDKTREVVLLEQERFNSEAGTCPASRTHGG